VAIEEKQPSKNKLLLFLADQDIAGSIASDSLSGMTLDEWAF